MKQLLIVMSLFGVNLYAGIIELEFDSLPSQQGWNYRDFGPSANEQNIFFIDGTKLSQNTIGIGFTGSGGNLYELPGVVDTSIPFTIEINISNVTREGSTTNNFGFGFGFISNGINATVGIGDGIVQSVRNDFLLDFGVGSFDTVRSFLMEVTPGSGYSVFLDGNRIIDNALFAGGGGSIDGLVFGDFTGGANAFVDISLYRFSQANAAVPEPSTYALFLIGLVGLGIIRQRTSR